MNWTAELQIQLVYKKETLKYYEEDLSTTIGDSRVVHLDQAWTHIHQKYMLAFELPFRYEGRLK